MKRVNIDGEESSYHLKNLRNFNDIFRENVTFDNIKVKKNKA